MDPSLSQKMVEVIGGSLNGNQVNEIGRLVRKDLDLHKALGLDSHVTIPSYTGAERILELCQESGCEDKLVQLLVELDGQTLLGKTVNLIGLEAFLETLTRSGYVYDFAKRKLRSTTEDPMAMNNWGALRSGKNYKVTVGSVDIVGNSELVRRYKARDMQKLYYRFQEFLRGRLATYNGRIWSWAGDGGIVAFTFKNHATRAIQWALETQATLPVFNTYEEYPIDEPILLRIALDSGTITFQADPGRIVSETVNYAAHLEKQATEPGSISLSEDTLRSASPRVASFFRESGDFEGRRVHGFNRGIGEKDRALG